MPKWVKKIQIVKGKDGRNRILLHHYHYKSYMTETDIKEYIRDCMLALKDLQTLE